MLNIQQHGEALAVEVDFAAVAVEVSPAVSVEVLEVAEVAVDAIQ